MFSKIRFFAQTYIPRFIQDFILFRILQNFLFRGMVSSSYFDVFVRLTFQLGVVLFTFFYVDVLSVSAFMFITFLSQIIFWLFDGHFWALKRTGEKRMVVNKPVHIKQYIYFIHKRLLQSNAVKYAVFSGSLARGDFGPNSDIDIWLIIREDYKILGSFIGIRERCLAFLHKIPIELYVKTEDDFYHSDLCQPFLVVIGDLSELRKEPFFVNLFPLLAITKNQFLYKKQEVIGDRFVG